MHAKYKVSTFYGSKVIAKVKVDNKETNRQDKNNMPPIIRTLRYVGKLLGPEFLSGLDKIQSTDYIV